jgi:hypothetical protein
VSTARARAELVAPWLAVAALVAWSAWHRWQVLTASPHPVGIDGYFYAIQVRALLERGALAYPAAPLTFYLMAALAQSPTSSPPSSWSRRSAARWRSCRRSRSAAGWAASPAGWRRRW